MNDFIASILSIVYPWKKIYSCIYKGVNAHLFGILLFKKKLVADFGETLPLSGLISKIPLGRIK
jgi:hypothetical protein